jgi:SAM-dependent methyltransferase
MTRDIDLLISPALTHLRDRWWDAAFTEFVRDTLRPQPGERVLEIGCGPGIPELMLGLLEPGGGTRYVGVDVDGVRLRQARGAARDHGLTTAFAVADVQHLPHPAAAFDATFAIGVLQHVPRPADAIGELARVTRPDGRLLLVEPDNHHRYWFSSVESGRRAFDASTRFFEACAREAASAHDLALGPHLPSLCRTHGIEAIAIHLFPVTVTRLGAPVPRVWQARREAVRQAIEPTASEETRALGDELADAIERYAAEGTAAGAAFVEIQNTMLFAMVGHRV